MLYDFTTIMNLKMMMKMKMEKKFSLLKDHLSIPFFLSPLMNVISFHNYNEPENENEDEEEMG